jgi:hypothetical protein
MRGAPVGDRYRQRQQHHDHQARQSHDHRQASYARSNKESSALSAHNHADGAKQARVDNGLEKVSKRDGRDDREATEICDTHTPAVPCYQKPSACSSF